MGIQRRLLEMLLLMSAVASPASAQGAFGLVGGLSLEQIGDLTGGVPTPVDGQASMFRVDNVPSPHSAFESYALIVTPGQGLCKIRALGKTIETNRYGMQLRTSFDDLSSALSKKYGNGKKMDRLMTGSIWNEPEDFMTALQKQERILAVVWSHDDDARLPGEISAIGLTAHALSDEKGYLTLDYEFSNFQACKEEMQSAEQAAL